MKKIIIKCFKTAENFYFYDRCTNSIVKVNLDEYEALTRVEKEGVLLDSDLGLQKFIDKGFLREAVTKDIKHPMSDELMYYAMNNIRQLILQVTQQCNLRCAYCAYSGNYYNRKHSEQKMSFETAKNAIDFYIEHSSATEDLAIAFYGGEPLLEFELIKKCVTYIEEQILDKEVSFYITTNGTILTDEIMKFIVEHNFRLTISLDGNKESHDVNRKFKNGKGSFDLVIENMKKIKSYNQEFYSRILINAVVNPKVDLKSVLDYFSESDLFMPHQIHLSLLSTSGLENSNLKKTDQQFWIPWKYEHLKLFLYMTDKVKRDSVNPLYWGNIEEINQLYRRISKHDIEPKVNHHAGPCIAGTRRLLVTVDGMFYPCERVSESIEEMKIGSLESGFDYKRMNAIMNIGQLSKEKCLNCWNLRLCTMCVGEITPIDGRITSEGKKCACSKSIEQTLYKLREICILNENGYSFTEDYVDEK